VGLSRPEFKGQAGFMDSCFHRNDRGKMCYNEYVIRGIGVAMAKKEPKDLKTFIENVNKKDKVNGKKVVFDFVKRKRK
jgi:hypothetical protein